MDIQNLLKKEIKHELEDLKVMQLGSEEYKGTVDGITKLIDKTIEIEKVDIELDEKERQKKIDKVERWLKYGLAAGTLAIQTWFGIWGVKKTFQFEETGTITSPMGRKFIDRILPKR